MRYTSNHQHQKAGQQKGNGARKDEVIQKTDVCQNGKWIIGDNGCHGNLNIIIHSHKCAVQNVTLSFKCSNPNGPSKVNQNPQTISRTQPKVNLISKPKQKSINQKARDNIRKSQYEFRKFCARQLPFSNLGPKAFSNIVNLNYSLKQELNALKAKHVNFTRVDKNKVSFELIKTSEELNEAKQTIQNQSQEISSLKLSLEENEEITKDLTKANQTINILEQEIICVKSEINKYEEAEGNTLMYHLDTLRITELNFANCCHKLQKVSCENENLRRLNDELIQRQNTCSITNYPANYTRRSGNNRR